MGDASQPQQQHARWTTQRATRPVRIANCSGARGDPGTKMLEQITLGDIDFITGDYLAEVNLPDYAVQVAEGRGEGWEPLAWDGLDISLEVIKEKGVKIVINGGALNPRGLAVKTVLECKKRGLALKVGYVYGDDMMDFVKEKLGRGELPGHLDEENSKVSLHENARDLLDTKGKPLVSANVYLGARGIRKGLEAGADIVICGRVADASPVIGAAAYWWGWRDDDFDALAGALVAGHLIECSAYATGANFSGFDEYPLQKFVDVPFGIAEVERDGSCVLTKHEGTNGLVNVDNALCQFLYELQGRIYLNSDVTADCKEIVFEQVGKDRVKVTGVRGFAPPPTTKLAIFYQGGFESQLLFNATGYGTAEKYALYEAQLRSILKQKGMADKFQLLDFQVIGRPEPNPRSQFASTTYLRIFSQADTQAALYALLKCFSEIVMQHFSGFHCSLDMRTALPRPYLAFYPAIYRQDELKEGFGMLATDGSDALRIDAGHPPEYQNLEARENYDTEKPIDLESLGPTKKSRLGDVILGRSGDKGANINFGCFVRKPEHYPWLKTFMNRAKMQELMGDDWRNEFFVERMEFPNVLAVHFVIYGPLGRGVTSCRLLDSLGKGFCDFIRDKVVDIPESILADMAAIKEDRMSKL